MERRAIERVRGTQDHWAGDAQRLADVRHRLEQTFASFGYAPIDVPVLEPAELHLRKSGLEIVSKLYSLTDQGGRQLCLRPELTASVVRAFVAQPPARLPLKVYSSGPVFRYERPSKGRFRQFSQTGVELIGADGALADAEVIALAVHALDRIGLAEYTVTIGHVGIVSELLGRLGLAGRLRAFLLESMEDVRRQGPDAVRQRLRELDPELFETPDSGSTPGVAGPEARQQAREAIDGLLAQMGTEALGRRSRDEVAGRMLDKLHPEARAQAIERALAFMQALGRIAGSPAEVLEHGRALLAEYELDATPLAELGEIVGLLDAFQVVPSRVRLDLGLSRGLQYYTGTVFEIDHAGLGSESQLCGGGRYDDLVRSLGGRQAVPALGFAFGVERVHLALAVEQRGAGRPADSAMFVVAASPGAVTYAVQVARALRTAGHRVHLDVAHRPLRTALSFADREGFTHVAVVGETEVRERTVKVKEMATGTEQSLAFAQLSPALMAAGMTDGVTSPVVTEQAAAEQAVIVQSGAAAKRETTNAG